MLDLLLVLAEQIREAQRARTSQPQSAQISSTDQRANQRANEPANERADRRMSERPDRRASDRPDRRTAERPNEPANAPAGQRADERSTQRVQQVEDSRAGQPAEQPVNRPEDHIGRVQAQPSAATASTHSEPIPDLVELASAVGVPPSDHQVSSVDHSTAAGDTATPEPLTSHLSKEPLPCMRATEPQALLTAGVEPLALLARPEPIAMAPPEPTPVIAPDPVFELTAPECRPELIASESRVEQTAAIQSAPLAEDLPTLELPIAEHLIAEHLIAEHLIAELAAHFKGVPESHSASDANTAFESHRAPDSNQLELLGSLSGTTEPPATERPQASDQPIPEAIKGDSSPAPTLGEALVRAIEELPRSAIPAAQPISAPISKEPGSPAIEELPRVALPAAQPVSAPISKEPVSTAIEELPRVALPAAEPVAVPMLPAVAASRDELNAGPAATSGFPMVHEIPSVEDPALDKAPSGSWLQLAPLQDYSIAAGRAMQPAAPSSKILMPDSGPRMTLPGPTLPPDLATFRDANILTAREAPRTNKLGVPGWLVSFLVMLGLVMGGMGLAFYIWPVAHSNAETKGSAESSHSGTQPASHSLADYIEVTGFRILVDFNKKSEIHYLVVNHTGAPVSDVTVYVTLHAADAKPGQPPLCRFSFRAPSLGPFESKEMTSSIEKLTRSITLPEWQDLRSEVQIAP